jgi:hypothetical protein
MTGKQCKKSIKLGGKKLAVMLASLVFVLCTAIGGTLAWLIAETEPVVNTFTYGDINITLTESDTGDNDGNSNTNTYNMIPGHTITKDPKVTFKANSEDAWLFVKLQKTANFDDFMTYAMADGWTKLDNVDGVYYREVSKAAQDAEFTVIKDNTVTVKGEVTKEMLNDLDANGASNYPKLIVTAYAVQRDSNIATAADAWAKIQPANP